MAGSRRKQLVLAVLGVVLLGAAGVVIGPWVYINFIKDDPPPPLSFADRDKQQGNSTTNVPLAQPPVGANSLSGKWTVVAPSQAGYRVKEVLFGQDTEAVGRTDAVEGTVTVGGSTITTIDLSVDLTSVKSDEERRDSQFQGRIMNTSEFPLATFTSTTPVPVAQLETDGAGVTVSVAGTLTLRGTEKPVTMTVELRRVGADVEVVGKHTVVFADYGIPDPSNVAASTGPDGVLEFALTLRQA